MFDVNMQVLKMLDVNMQVLKMLDEFSDTEED